MKWRQRTLDDIADMICGNGEGTPFVYRSSSYITRFFREADTEFTHGGSTRAAWVSSVLEQILAEPHPDAQTPAPTFCRVIATLMDVSDATNGDPDRAAALSRLNAALAREGLKPSMRWITYATFGISAQVRSPRQQPTRIARFQRMS